MVLYKSKPTSSASVCEVVTFDGGCGLEVMAVFGFDDCGLA